ncbi:hypothetical protein Ctob_004798 [Chrysochromulina tobinii]|uniref:EamA domain-containing protein n=1 Tax=Chrysochromulina tobinii TaxID=1460289 RepID=A0A0M0K064_9EUKA|nr:hypothetical protein Ctob_004798 [Chrysochromulina tobinii]|eukprot:KOO31952.1 hypothetical protein Ctob_004798 [Chrysochromulina sp. CCMP291]
MPPSCFLLVCLVATVSVDARVQSRPLMFTPKDVHATAVHRLRGGLTPVTAGALARAKLLLLLANAGFGSYTVFLRSLATVPGAEPLGMIFIVFVRYNVLCLLATITRTIQFFMARREPDRAKGRSDSEQSPHLAAFELALLSVLCSFFSVWGTCRVPAAMAEIFQSTDNVFVPLLSVLLGLGDFGARTWAACGLAFGAAVLVAVVDGIQDGSGMTSAALNLRGAAALVVGAFLYGWFRVRTTVHLQSVSAASLNLLRMCYMGGISTAVMLLDVARGGPSAATVRRIRHIPLAQFGLMALGVFVPGFLSSSVQFEAMRSISAAKAQPFAALQPLFAGIMGYLALREPVSIGTWVGGVFMIFAALLACSEEEGVGASAVKPALSADEGAVVISKATPGQVASTFPLKSRLDIVEGAIADEILHKLADGQAPPAEARRLSLNTLPLGLGLAASIAAIVSRGRADEKEKTRAV